MLSNLDNIATMKHSVRPSISVVEQLFIAAPMSGFSSDDEYNAHRQATLKLIERLEETRIANAVYYAGTAIASSDSYSGSNSAFHTDVTNLVASNAMLFLYPNKVVSSALVEVGIAIGRCLPILIVVNDRNDLPYMIKDVETYEDVGDIAPPIKIIECKSPLDEIDEIVRFFNSVNCGC